MAAGSAWIRERSRASSVMATANTPSLNASRRPVSVGAPRRGRKRILSILRRAYSETTVERVSDIVAMSIIDISLPETSLVSAPIARAALSASR